MNRNTVPDGWYKIRCEFTTRNGQGPWTPVDYFRFYKSSNAVDTMYNSYNYNNQLAFSNISLVYTPDVTYIDAYNSNLVISEFNLYQNYPNPFNPSTTIEFDVPQQNGIVSQASVIIYNSIGREIKTIFKKNVESGKHRIKWNGKDNKILSNQAVFTFTN